MRGVFLDFGTVSNGDLDPAPLARAVPGLVIHERTLQPEVAARMAGFEAVFANKSVIDRAAIAANPQLRLVALTATGVDNVDLAAAREAGVAVCNLRDYCTESVAHHAFAMLLALTRRLRDYDALARSSIDSYSPSNARPVFGADGPSSISTSFTPGRILAWIASTSGRNSALTRITSSWAWLIV